MNYVARILTIGTLSTLGLSGTALADGKASNTSGSFGMGYASTLAGVRGISLRYGLGGGMLVEGVLGYSSSTMTQTNKKTNGVTEGDMAVGVSFDYKPSSMRGDKVAGSIFGELNYGQQKAGVISDGEETGQQFSDIAFGTGMRVEIWPAGWMSLNTKFGLSISPNGEGQQVGAAYGGDDDDSGDDDTTYGGMDIALTGNLWGGAGVTFWF